MQSNFERALNWILLSEGGYVNHPADTGGATNFGITQKTYGAFLAARGIAERPVKNISKTEVRAIYEQEYAQKIQFNLLPAGVDYALLDFAVHSGVRRAAKTIQKIAGVPTDGIIGAQTLKALKQQPVEPLIEALCMERMAFLKRLKNWHAFKRGWTTRVIGKRAGYQSDDIGVLDRAIGLAMGAKDIPAPVLATEKADGAQKTSATLAHSKRIIISISGVLSTLGALNEQLLEIADFRNSITMALGNVPDAVWFLCIFAAFLAVIYTAFWDKQHD